MKVKEIHDKYNKIRDVSYPCWFVSLDNIKNLEEAKWNVGVCCDCHKDQYSFLLKSLGNMEDRDFLKRITSLDFALDLISAYKDGGSMAVEIFVAKIRKDIE